MLCRTKVLYYRGFAVPHLNYMRIFLLVQVLSLHLWKEANNLLQGVSSPLTDHYQHIKKGVSAMNQTSLIGDPVTCREDVKDHILK